MLAKKHRNISTNNHASNADSAELICFQGYHESQQCSRTYLCTHRFLEGKCAHFHDFVMVSEQRYRRRALPPLLSPEEQARERKHKPMSKLSLVPAQQQVLLQLALVPVEKLPVEQNPKESVETYFFITVY
jgi:hypothetical protein